MKNIFILLIILSFISCNENLLIESRQEGVQLEVQGEIMNLPTQLNIKPQQQYRFFHAQYPDKIFSGREIINEGDDKFILDMMDSLFSLKITHLGENGTLIINGIHYDEPIIYLPQDEYHILMKKPGFQNQELDLLLNRNRIIEFQGTPYYQISRYPKDIIQVELNGEIIKPETPFLLGDQDNELIIHKKDESLSFFISNDGQYIENYIIDLEILSRWYNTITGEEYKDFLSFSGSWFHTIDERLTLATFNSFATGFDNYPPLIDEVNKFIREPEGNYPDVSISNPTNELLGAKVILESASESKTIIIDEHFFEDNLKEYDVKDSTNDSIVSAPILVIWNLDFHAPYHRVNCNISLEKNGLLLDQITFTENDIDFFLNNNNIGLYRKPRNSFFYNETYNSTDIYYLYLSETYNGSYLGIYMNRDSFLPCPILIAELKDIDDTPLIIELIGEGRRKEFNFIIQPDLENFHDYVPDWGFFEGRFRGSLY